MPYFLTIFSRNLCLLCNEKEVAKVINLFFNFFREIYLQPKPGTLGYVTNS